MTEFDPQETVTVKFDGGTYKVRKYLTVGEEIARKGRRSEICGGQYGAMSTSKDLDERSVAMMADFMTELDARIVDGPKAWKGAEAETDDGRLIDLWKEMAAALGRRFPQEEGPAGKEPGNPQGDSKKEPEDGMAKEMVPGEIQSGSER